ncbi:MAG TPA: hypothetical protein VIX20_11725 [Ktedonobacteraceae bacterium]
MMLQALQRHFQSYSFAGFGIAALLVLLCAFLAGCGSYVPSQGGQSQTTPSTTPTSIPAFTPSPTLAQQAQNCGKVDTTLNGKPVDANQARLAGNCFWQAFQNCQAASLILKEHSLDTGADHTFTMKGTTGRCSIMDTVKHYIVPNNLNLTRSYTCSGLVMQADGLHFIACGSLGNIFMPI